MHIFQRDISSTELAKKRRRLIKKVAVICGAITIAVLIYLVPIAVGESIGTNTNTRFPHRLNPPPGNFTSVSIDCTQTSSTRNITAALNLAIIGYSSSQWVVACCR